MYRRVRREYLLLILAAMTFVARGLLAAEFDPIELQTEFGRAKDLTLITKVADIPAEGGRKLENFALGFGWPASSQLADIGMDWSFSDARQAHLPWGQHRFSARSDRLLAMVFVIGGVEARYRVILAPRNSNAYCLFNITSLGDEHMRLSVVQDLLRPDRDQTVSKTPRCEMRALGRPVQ